MADTNQAESIIEFAKETGEPSFFELDRANSAVVLPTGKNLHSIKALIDEYRQAPERIKTTANLDTADAFIDYMNRFKRPGGRGGEGVGTFQSAVFVRGTTGGSASLLGVIDYHDRRLGADRVTGEDRPSFCEHRATYSFPLSPQMTAWVKATLGGPMTQETFATFLRDREYDIENPPADWMMIPKDQLDLILDLLNLHDDRGTIDDGAEDEPLNDEGDDRYISRSALHKLRKLKFGTVQRLLDLSRGVEITVNSKATQAFNPKTGERSLSFQEEHDTANSASRRVKVPELFFIFVPVFDGGARHLMPVRLTYRMAGQSVRWIIELIDAKRLIRSAIDHVAEEVQEKTGLPIFYGAPFGTSA